MIQLVVPKIVVLWFVYFWNLRGGFASKNLTTCKIVLQILFVNN